MKNGKVHPSSLSPIGGFLKGLLLGPRLFPSLVFVLFVLPGVFSFLPEILQQNTLIESLKIQESQAATSGQMILYFHKEPSDINETYNALSFTPPAILHDIGRIGIHEQILNKPAKLSQEESALMKTHPTKGAEIIKHVKFLAPVVPMVRHDHERWDGKGYPDGLKGEAIPFGARIVAIVDAYDAMTTDRVYRTAPGKTYAISELKENAGTQFDPDLVEVFLSVLEEQKGIEDGTGKG